MATVTKVTKQRRPGRYNIYLDDVFALAVDEKILIDFNLFKGTELDPEQLEKVQLAEYEQKAYATALVYATGQLRSRYQVYLKLREKDFPQNVINQALDRLEAAHVIDDQTFAKSYMQNMSQNGKYGHKGALEKLKAWGIKPDVLEEVNADYDDQAELTHLEVAVPKLMQKYQRNAYQMAKQKTVQKLLQKGFAIDNINQALQAYEDDYADEPNEEWDNLVRDGEKAYQRYQQYTGWELERRVKTYLARRGYRFDDINHFVAQYPENN